MFWINISFSIHDWLDYILSLNSPLALGWTQVWFGFLFHKSRFFLQQFQYNPLVHWIKYDSNLYIVFIHTQQLFDSCQVHVALFVYFLLSHVTTGARKSISLSSVGSNALSCFHPLVWRQSKPRGAVYHGYNSYEPRSLYAGPADTAVIHVYPASPPQSVHVMSSAGWWNPGFQ